MDLPKVISL